MESLKLSFDAIMPIFILMALGYLIKKLKLADKKTLDSINKLIFKIFLPVLLFYNIYTTETAEVFDVKLMAFAAVGTVSVFILGYFAVLLITKDNAKRGVMLQDFFRANFAILGIPLVNYICNKEASELASLMVAVIIPVFNILAVISLEIFRGGEKRVNVLELLKDVITNPLIIGCVFGIIFFVFDIKLPFVLEKSIKDISSVATPLSIVILGSIFEFSGCKACVKETVITILTKLVIVPLIIIPIAVLMGFTGEALACLLVVFGGPVAVSSFPMAQQMGGDETLAVQVVVLSSALCLVTLFCWISALSYLGLF